MCKRTSEYIAPSWSWASIEFPEILRFAEIPYPFSNGRLEEKAPVEKLDIFGKDGDDKFGQIAGGYIIISGQWRKCDHWNDVPPPKFKTPHKFTLFHEADDILSKNLDKRRLG